MSRKCLCEPCNQGGRHLRDTTLARRHPLFWIWKRNGKDGTRPVCPVCRHDLAAQRLHKTAANGKPEAGSRALPIALLDAMELLENTFEQILRNPRPFIEDLDRNRAEGPFRPHRDQRSLGRIL